jgi:hypothetical protein
LDPVASVLVQISGDDWIGVDGDASDGHRHWDFRGDVLVRADLDRIAQWLDDVAVRRIPTTGVEDEPSLTFTEPSLAFSVGTYGDESVELRIHLTHWFAPPWLDPDEVLSTYTYFVALSLALGDLEGVATAWNAQAAQLLG